MNRLTSTIEILIVYYSRSGLVKLLADAIADGARRVPGVQVRFLEVDEQPIDELRPGETLADMEHRRAEILKQLSSANALVVGAPSYFGSMAASVKRLFEDSATAGRAPAETSRPWRYYVFRDKVGAAFTASGTPHGGNEQTLQSILTMMMHLGMIVVTPGQGEPILENPAAPYGATAVAGPDGNHPLTAEEQEAARALGRRVAEITTWLSLGGSSKEALRDQPRLDRRQPYFDPSA